MERMLQKMAHQLNACDEASLMALWDKYANSVEEFEPSRRWEEAALLFCLLQAVRWKNQLFNFRLAQTAKPRQAGGEMPPGFDEVKALIHNALQKDAAPLHADQPAAGRKKRRKVLRFHEATRDMPE